MKTTMKTTAIAFSLTMLALSTSALANGTTPAEPTPTCPPGVQSCNIAGVFKGSNSGDTNTYAPDSASASVGDVIAQGGAAESHVTGNQSTNHNQSSANNTATNTMSNGNISNDVTGGQQTNTQTATQTQGNLTQSIGDQRGHTIGRQTATTTSGAASTNSGNITTRGGKAVATGGQGGNSRSTSSVRNSGNSTNTVGNVNTIDASQRTTIKHAANTAAMIDMQGYGMQNCLGDSNPSGQFGASIQTFGWGVTANSMKASNVCAMLKIAGPRAALAYLAQMDRNAHAALVNNGLAVTRSQIEAQVLAEAEAEAKAKAGTSKNVQTVRCPEGSRWDGRGCWMPKR